MRQVKFATAFIDWDTARRIVRPIVSRGPNGIVEQAIVKIQDQLASTLLMRYKETKFRVTMRLYHGWHRGKSKTQDRIDIEQYNAKKLTQRLISNVSFAPELFFGNELLCGGRRRILYDTLRSRYDSKDVQKMVDTALTSDLLHYVRTNRNGLAVVIGDDDDLLPGIFTAETWGGEVLLTRMRCEENRHLNTNGILCQLGE